MSSLELSRSWHSCASFLIVKWASSLLAGFIWCMSFDWQAGRYFSSNYQIGPSLARHHCIFTPLRPHHPQAPCKFIEWGLRNLPFPFPWDKQRKIYNEWSLQSLRMWIGMCGLLMIGCVSPYPFLACRPSISPCFSPIACEWALWIIPSNRKKPTLSFHQQLAKLIEWKVYLIISHGRSSNH